MPSPCRRRLNPLRNCRNSPFPEHNTEVATIHFPGRPVRGRVPTRGTGSRWAMTADELGAGCRRPPSDVITRLVQVQSDIRASFVLGSTDLFLVVTLDLYNQGKGEYCRCPVRDANYLQN